MTDAHCHVSCGDATVREFVVGREFFGIHPWETVGRTDVEVGSVASSLRAQLLSNPAAGVGEIGLDRLKERTISAAMREIFEVQLGLAIELRRPVVLHGAKCWGEVVAACRRHKGRIPAFMFHGFSRSAGLLPEIFAMNGFVSVGQSLLNDHAVNYRELVAQLPPARVLVETDMPDDDPAADRLRTLSEIYAKLAELRGLTLPELASETEANVTRFLGR